MSRKILTNGLPRQPSCRLHKARKCAVVTVAGKNHYLGPYDSPESHEKYARLIAEWKTNRNAIAGGTAPPTNCAVTVNLLVLKYLDWAETYYVKHGQPTGEVNNLGTPCSPRCCGPRR
jgi:hypothetical protein